MTGQHAVLVCIAIALAGCAFLQRARRGSRGEFVSAVVVVAPLMVLLILSVIGEIQ